MKKEVNLSHAHRLINHGPVVLVTSVYGDLRPNILAVAWVTPLSQNPPLAGISVAEGHHSHAMISNSGEFAINIPPVELANEVVLCGKYSGSSVDKFFKAQLTPEAANRLQAPLIKECIGHLECRVVHRLKVGDHTFFVGRVLAASADGELFGEIWHSDAAGGAGLHHLGGKTFSVSERRIIVE